MGHEAPLVDKPHFDGTLPRTPLHDSVQCPRHLAYALIYQEDMQGRAARASSWANRPST